VTQVLGRILDATVRTRELHRSVAFSLVYPLVLLAVSYFLLASIALLIVPEFEEIFRDFGIAIGPLSKLVLEVGQAVSRAGIWIYLSPVLAIGAAWLAARLLFGPAERARIVMSLPLWGSLHRWSGIAEWSRILGLLLEQGLSLREALEQAAPGLSNAEFAESSRAAAQSVRAGQSLGEALAARSSTPKGFPEFLDWACAHRNLPESLALVADFFDSRARSQGLFLSRYATAMLLSLVVWLLVVVMLGLLWPLINLLDAISGVPTTARVGTALESFVMSFVQPSGPLFSAIAAIILIVLVLFRRRLFSRLAAWARFFTSSRRRRRRIGLRHLMFAIVPLALLFVAGRELGFGFFLMLGVVLLPILVLGSVLLRSSRRASQQDALVRVLAIAASEGLPLAPAANAFASMCQGIHGAEVELFAQRLARGEELSAVLRNLPRVFPREAAILARVGFDSGSLGPSMQQAVLGLDDWRAHREARKHTLWYPLAVLGLMFLLTLFGVMQVSPRLVLIGRDFGLAEQKIIIPRTAAALGELLQPWLNGSMFIPWLSVEIPNLFIAILGLAAVCGLTLWLFVRAIPNAARRWFPSSLEARHDRVILQRGLAAGLEQGRTLSESLGRLAKAYPVRFWKRQLGRAREGIDRGGAWQTWLSRVGVCRRADTALLESSSRLGHLPWAMQILARTSERRLHAAYRARARRLQVAMTLVLGALALVYALSYFQPIVGLIEAAQEWIP
jgi:type II secretory pathway component PulF